MSHKNTGGGLELNLEIMVKLLGLTIPAPNAHLQYTRDEIYIHVTNNIIHRKRVLKQVETFDGSSTSIAENFWDKLTGNVLLTRVQNNFKDENQPDKHWTYSYTIPAYLKYEGMSGAFQNIGIEFDAQLNKIKPPN